MKNYVVWILLMGLLSCQLSAQELIDKVQIDFTGIEKVNVRGAFCKTEFYAGSGDALSLEGEIRGLRKYEGVRIRHSQEGSLLEVWIEHPRNVNDQLRGYLVFNLPRDTEINVVTLSGSIILQGVGYNKTFIETLSGTVDVERAITPLEIKSSSGSVSAKSLQGDVSINTISGGIAIEDAKSSCSASSVSGSINASELAGGIKAATISGGITAQGVSGKGEAKSVSGSIKFSDVKGSIEATSSSGSIQLSEISGSVAANTVSGTISGDGIYLKDSSSFKSTSGSIEVLLANKQEDLSFDLRSTSGRLSIFGKTGSKQMLEGQGQIKVIGVTTSGSQRYK